MKHNLISRITLCGLLFTGFFTNAQKSTLEVDVAKSITKIQPTMFGLFFEDINFAADGGLYAEMVKNRSFEFEKPLMGWEQPNTKRLSQNKQSGYATPIYVLENKTNPNFCRVLVNDDKGYAIVNEGFRGMGDQKRMRNTICL